ncbi:MAG: HAD-IA family hydrolase [Phycisphaeraceae bacterium]
MSRIKAFFFDQDGVIIDTERDGHRVAFNRTFKDFGFDVEWDEQYYHELLQVGGGKERMRYHLDQVGFGKPVPEDEKDELIKKLHKHKTDLFIEMIESGQLPLRPGVHRFMKEVNRRGLTLGVCTTSNERAAKAVTQTVLSDIEFDFVLAGDVVPRKKPDPAIYNLALERSGCKPEQCVVIEDSHIGVTAAKRAGMHVVATTNMYTQQEDLSHADVVVTCLGDGDTERGELACPVPGLEYDGILTVEQLLDLFDSKDRDTAHA